MNRLLSKMVALRKKDQVGEKKVPKSPHKNPEMNPIICYESIFAENCDESVDSCCVAEEMMEVVEGGGGLEEMPLNESQEDPTSEEKTRQSYDRSPQAVGGDGSLHGALLLVWVGLHRGPCHLHKKHLSLSNLSGDSLKRCHWAEPGGKRLESWDGCWFSLKRIVFPRRAGQLKCETRWLCLVFIGGYPPDTPEKHDKINGLQPSAINLVSQSFVLFSS